jgi:hypothetical protein
MFIQSLLLIAGTLIASAAVFSSICPCRSC